MNRKDFVLVWKEGNIIYCNQMHCYNDKVRLRRRDKKVSEYCPFDSKTSFCDESQCFSIPKSVYNNKTCLPIATLKDCIGRQYGCTKECNSCMVLLIQRVYYETH